ncbi:AraC family transcriptional regulator [Actinomadura sp. 1N219]|uniref:AraC family transcriptional regulator n=1 Tax=Actinomadura sp. 1N219 TaxID=3375152 RepID=UPI0037AE7069
MDLLSDAILVMRTGRPHSARTERRPPWAVSHPPFPGAGVHVMLQGTCVLTVADGDPVTVGPGDVVLLPHGDAHALGDASSGPPPGGPSVTPLTGLDDQPPADGPVVMLCGAYLLDVARRHPLLGELPAVVHLPARHGRHPSLHAAVDLLATELERPHPGSDALRAALLDALLIYAIRAWYEQQSDHHHSTTGWGAALRDPALQPALNAIHTDPGRAWTVQDLGAKAGLSRTTFSRRFTATLGQPPMAYLTWWRMTLAARLLRDSDAPLSAVAQRIGYTSEFAFANAFKREFGVAPGRYRKQCQET